MVPSAQFEHWDVQHEKRSIDLMRQPAQSLQRQLDLAHAVRGRDGELAPRRAANHAVGIEPMALWKCLTRLHERTGVDANVTSV